LHDVLLFGGIGARGRLYEILRHGDEDKSSLLGKALSLAGPNAGKRLVTALRSPEKVWDALKNEDIKFLKKIEISPYI